MFENFAFIDESGNHDLHTEKSGASKYFMVLAILTNSDRINNLRQSVENIRISFFGEGNEIKSSKVQDDRRLRIIEKLVPIDFKFYAVAIKKENIFKDSGLQYKKSFIKYSNNRLYSTLFQNSPDIKVFADGHGGSEFIESFKKYIYSKNTDLFSTASLEILDSKNEVLIQLADFMVGTLAKIYENRSPEPFKSRFSEFIREKCIKIDEWPITFTKNITKPTTASREVDEIIKSTSINKAHNFLKINERNFDELVQQQCHALEYLVVNAIFNDEEGFILTDDIVNYLQKSGFSKVTKQSFRSSVIAKLRDSDVIISSSGKGYKIPTTYKDMITFAELVDDHALPLLSRLSRAREAINIATQGEIDFLDQEKFKTLKTIIESTKL